MVKLPRVDNIFTSLPINIKREDTNLTAEELVVFFHDILQFDGELSTSPNKKKLSLDL